MELNSISSIRTDYTKSKLDDQSVLSNPIEQFNVWFNEALNAEVMEPNAMCLSTINADGRPSSRIVLLKGVEDDGLVFFTHYASKKGKALEQNPYVSVVFFWPELQRQVRIEGVVSKTPIYKSEEYFQSRPKGSQISATVSPQSSKILNRELLEEESERLSKIYESQDVLPKPENWGGFLITPNLFEFWQGRASRLHDRIQFELKTDGLWEISRLAP